MRNADWTTSVSVFDRVTAVFDAFGEHGEGLGVSEIARRANLPKSTVSRIATDLVEQRFLDRNGSKLYLGVRLFELGQTVGTPRKLRDAALPLMNELRTATGRSVDLAVLDHADIVLVAVLRRGHEPHPIGPVGARRPAHLTALGKAMLAFSAHGRVENISRGVLDPGDPGSIGESSNLRRELADVRQTRIATERDECAKGRVSVASPVLSRGAVPIAAISVTGSIEEIDVARLAPTVRAAAVKLGHRIGGDPSE
jgi:IclR family acetate operon transcriptional repressor